MFKRTWERAFKYRSIKWNMTVAFSLLLIICINAVAYLFFVIYSETAERNAKNYTYGILEQVNKNIEYYLRYMEDISNLTFFNGNIQSYLRDSIRESDYLHQVRRTFEREAIAEYFNSFLSIRQDIVSIYIFAANGEILTNRPHVSVKDYMDIREQLWYKRAKEADGAVVISPPHVRNVFEDDYQWVVSLSRVIKHLDTKESLGVLLIDLNFRVIEDICEHLGIGSGTGYVFIVDRDGELVYHPEQQLIYSNLKNEDFDLIMNTGERFVTSRLPGREKLYTIAESEFTGWKVVGVTYTDELVPDIRDIQNFIIALALVSIPLTLVLSTLISSRISRPLKRLAQTMKQVDEQQDLDIYVNIEGSREVAFLSKSFNTMLTRIRELMSQLLMEQELKRKSELKALQAQINPHFLYNTLDLVIWMTKRGKTEEVIQLVSSLSRLFRLSIGKGDEMTSVRDEVEHIKHYLLIQKLRYKSKLEFIIDVEHETYRYKMPRLILQPLVENAIYHGIKPLPGGGCVTVRGYLQRQPKRTDLVLEVKDNGTGIPEDKLKDIFNGAASKLREGGIGVKNIQERIRLYAGEGYGLEYESASGAGTKVRVVLPAIDTWTDAKAKEELL